MGKSASTRGYDAAADGDSGGAADGDAGAAGDAGAPSSAIGMDGTRCEQPGRGALARTFRAGARAGRRSAVQHINKKRACGAAQALRRLAFSRVSFFSFSSAMRFSMYALISCHLRASRMRQCVSIARGERQRVQRCAMRQLCRPTPLAIAALRNAGRRTGRCSGSRFWRRR